MLFVVMAAVSAGHNSSTSCELSAASANARPAPYTSEYSDFVARSAASSLDTIRVASAGVLCPLELDDTVVGETAAVVGSAHRLTQSLLVRGDSQACVYAKVAIDNTLTSLGMAYFGVGRPGRNIALSPTAVAEPDLLFLTTVHEFFHLLGFGQSAFVSLVDVPTAEYTSQAVRRCVSATGTQPELPVEMINPQTVGSHWAESAPAPFSLLKPHIDSQSRLAACTVVAAAELSGGVSQACGTNLPCDASTECVAVGPHLPSICTTPPPTPPGLDRPDTPHFPAFGPFFAAVAVLLRLLMVCASHSNTRAALEIRGRLGT